MTNTENVSPAMVSSTLRKAGLGIVTTRSRPGLLIQRSRFGSAVVVAQQEVPTQAALALANATEVLNQAGYTVRPSTASDAIIYVSKEI